MSTPVRITVLADNTVEGRTVCGEHGLCFHLQAGSHALLFDTGQGRVLAGNAEALDVDLGAVETLVLSHGHYDHTGGIPVLADTARNRITVHAHPDALQPKYHGQRAIGVPEASRAALEDPRVDLKLSREPEELLPGLWRTGEIPVTDTPEKPTEIFHLDPDGLTPDPLRDDQSLFLETPEGTVVLLGCAHAGVIRILDRVRELTGGAPIRAVLGGMHLGNAGSGHLQWVIEQLHRLSPALLVPMHCTGPQATAALWHTFPDACRPGGAGSRFSFQCRKEIP